MTVKANSITHWTLAKGQAGFIKTLQRGPTAFPEGLFSATPDRAVLGLKTHANTISHARLVALEETFPRVRKRMGDARFNEITRAFVEHPSAMQSALPQIGKHFGDFLRVHGQDAQTIDLARFEWAWLESYHETDDVSLTMANISALDEASLIALPIILHPSVRVIALSFDAANAIPELGDIGDSRTQVNVLILRPDTEVRIQVINPDQSVIIAEMQNILDMGNLLAFALETFGEASALPLIFGLIEAGAMCKAENLVRS